MRFKTSDFFDKSKKFKLNQGKITSIEDQKALKRMCHTGDICIVRIDGKMQPWHKEILTCVYTRLADISQDMDLEEFQKKLSYPDKLITSVAMIGHETGCVVVGKVVDCDEDSVTIREYRPELFTEGTSLEEMPTSTHKRENLTLMLGCRETPPKKDWN